MTKTEAAFTYGVVTGRFNLNHTQRSKLDASEWYVYVLRVAHEERWDDVQSALQLAGIVELATGSDQ